MFRELTPPAAYQELAEKSDGVLVDCRSPAEWYFTGTPDLSGLGKNVVLAAIASESGQMNPQFLDKIKSVASNETPIYIMCRVGGRSANACQILAAEGFSDLVNVIEGFEGQPNAAGHRNSVEGWKFHNLPWRQN
ncbi:rhodanese-like domain-containing protein [Alphaproteobacteria bacterium]|nr:rhodanese-like domain-containing protein [Alphaproteobacteria bacterium]